jgi:hypothetical protein
MENGSTEKAVHTDITIEQICGELEKYWDRQDQTRPGEFTVKDIRDKMKGSRETVRVKLEKLVEDDILEKRKSGAKTFYKFIKSIKE